MWSGGHDSTYTIQKLLEGGHTVNAVYVALHNNKIKAAMEQAAIAELRKVLELNSRFEYLGTRAEICIYGVSPNLILSQALCWAFCAAMWKADYDQIALAYIMNDDAISYLEDIKGAYYGFRGLRSDCLPELIFPLTKTSKVQVLQNLLPELRKHCVTCEFPRRRGEKFIPCGKCRSCKRLCSTKEET